MLAPLSEHYDLALLDCPRRRSRWCPKACSARPTPCSVPLIPSTLTLRTFEQLSDFVDAEVDRQPDIVAFFSMVDQRKRLHREVVETL